MDGWGNRPDVDPVGDPGRCLHVRSYLRSAPEFSLHDGAWGQAMRGARGEDGRGLTFNGEPPELAPSLRYME